MARYNLETISVGTKRHDSIDDISSLGENVYKKSPLYYASELKDNIYFASENWDNWCYNGFRYCSTTKNNHYDNFHFTRTREACIIIEEELNGAHYYHCDDVCSFKSLSRNLLI